MPTYRQIYDRLQNENLDLIDSLCDAIDDYVAAKNSFYSTEAGRQILRSWERTAEWTEECGTLAPNVFGVVLNEHLRGDWTFDETSKGKKYIRN